MNGEELPKNRRPRESVDAARSRLRHIASEMIRARRGEQAPRGSGGLLSVAVIDLDGRKSPGLSVEPSPGELTVFFGRRIAPSYRLGEVVQLCLKSPYLPRALVAAGWVRRAEVTNWGPLYTVKLIDWPGLLSQIPQELADLFDTRSDRRVLLDSDRPVVLKIDGLPPASWDQVFADEPAGLLLDLSPRGLTFRVDASVGQRLLKCKSVRVSFTLPETTEESSFWIQIISCVPDRDRIYCGALFDEAGTEDFPGRQEKLVRALQGKFSSGFRVLDKTARPVSSDYIRVWAEN